MEAAMQKAAVAKPNQKIAWTSPTPSKKSGKKTTKKAKPTEPTLADRLDKHRLYQLSVQSPEADLETKQQRARF